MNSVKIKDLLNERKYTLSFEVFPPKTSAVYDSVKNATEEIAKLSPSFMSVTYGAGGGTSQYTLDIAKNINEKYGVPSIAHLTCISSTEQTVKEMIGKIKDAGIVNIFALRGDMPKDFEPSSINGLKYRHATDLIYEIKSIAPDFCIGGACYPEVHPESESRDTDIKHLKEKADAGCDFLTTQMFFDNNLLYSFLYKTREAGITIPVLPAIMPITSSKQIGTVLKLSGSFLPWRFRALVDRFGNDDLAMKQAGIAYATDQIIDLFANGITHVHIYTMNKPDVARGILDNLSHIINTEY